MLKVRTMVIAVIAVASIAAATALAEPMQPAKPATAASKAAPAKPTAMGHHVMVAPSAVKWGPGPEALPPGSQMAVLDGDPSKAGSAFVLRAKMPDGYKIGPHWHPTDETIVVLSGSFLLGMGDKFDQGSMTALDAGGYARMPKQVRHSAMARGETVIQVSGTGPFAITYVNASDDPRKKTH